MIVPRPPKFGGDMAFSVRFTPPYLAHFIEIFLQNYEEVEAAFVLPEDNPNKLFSSDLKKGVLTELIPMIAHMRKVGERGS